MSDSPNGVCIVTQPQRSSAGKDHAHDLANIIAEISTVSILTANLSSDSDLRDDHEVIEFSAKGTGENVFTEALRFFLNQLRLCRAITTRQEDTILFFGTTSYILPVVWSKIIGKTVLVLPRGDVPLSLQLRWEKTMPDTLARVLAGAVALLENLNYRLADAIITYTPSMADQLGLGRYEKKLFTSGARYIDTSKFDVQVPFEEREMVVGFIGRLDVEKRMPELAVAAKKLPENIRFVFVGDGNYREQLEKELAEEIEEGKVELVGWVDRGDVPEQLNRLRLQIVPSHPTEGLPTAILEGMACGTPAFATPVSGVPEVVREGETGFLMDDVDGEQIAMEIEDILAREDLDGISISSRKLIEGEYGFEAAVTRYDAILTSSCI